MTHFTVTLSLALIQRKLREAMRDIQGHTADKRASSNKRLSFLNDIYFHPTPAGPAALRERVQSVDRKAVCTLCDDMHCVGNALS